MYNGTTVSLKTVLWKVLNNPYASELSYELAAEYAIEAIRLIGAPLSLNHNVTNPPLKVVNHKVGLPTNLISIKGVKAYSDINENNDDGIAMTYATDTFHKGSNCETDCNNIEEFTYTAENGVMFTSFSEGYVQIAYLSLPIDDEGYPLVTNDQDTLLALEYYILFRYLEPLWVMGKIQDKVFSYIDTKKCWYMGAAGTSLKLAGPDHLEAVMNGINRLIINNAHSSSFKSIGKKERIKKYN